MSDKYVMVPVEPSEKMLDILYHNGPGLDDHLLAAIWAELLAAAPKAEPQPSDDAKDALVEALEDAIDYLNEPLNSIQHGSILYSQMCEALATYRAAQEKK